jgi:hypothetical protein
MLIWSLPGFLPHFFQDLHKNWSTLTVRSITKLHQARCMTTNKRTLKVSTSTHLYEILYTVSQDMLIL